MTVFDATEHSYVAEGLDREARKCRSIRKTNSRVDKPHSSRRILLEIASEELSASRAVSSGPSQAPDA